jgi:serine/threonine protein kinase
LENLLEKDPEDRPTAIEALRSPWFFSLQRGIKKCIEMNSIASFNSEIIGEPKPKENFLNVRPPANSKPTMIAKTLD